MSGDRFIARAVVCFLGTVAIVGLIGLILIVSDASRRGVEVDAGLIGIVSSPVVAAIAALGALLARTGATSDPQPVHVTNPADEPVPVDPA